MNPFDIQLIIHNDCKLTSIFIDQIENIDTNYVSIEYLKYKNNLVINSEVIKYTDILSHSEFALFNDGVFEYNRYFIPKLEYLLYESDQFDAIGNMLYNSICLTDQIFVYNNTIYYINIADISIDEYLTSTAFIKSNIDFILDNAIIISISELSNTTEIGHSAFFCKKNILTYCNLIKCFVTLQSDLINSSCDSFCEKTHTYDRDFLLSTIYVLDYLRDINNFKEAQRILDNINECGGFCKSDTLTKCNCCG
jgi:hypothetical protein